MPNDEAPALPPSTPEADAALLGLLTALKAGGYRFVTPTPLTHARVTGRAAKREGRNLRDVFGWSLPFAPSTLPSELLAQLQDSGALAEETGKLRSRVRVASLGDLLFLHSAYPTQAQDAVFFGPDSYRFADFITNRLSAQADGARIVDIGAGAGVGGIVAGRLRPRANILLTDLNAKALHLAQLNAQHAGVAVQTAEAEGFDGLPGAFDAVLINPPYIIDTSGRAYRDGGDMHGARVALDLALQAVEQLAPGGQLLLYTGAPIVDGRDELRDALAPKLPPDRFALDYRELDPDVFGEELERPEYADVERIAVIGAVVTRRP